MSKEFIPFLHLGHYNKSKFLHEANQNISRRGIIIAPT